MVRLSLWSSSPSSSGPSTPSPSGSLSSSSTLPPQTEGATTPPSTLQVTRSPALDGKERVLDPTFAASQIRTEIYNHLQRLDEEQDKIERLLSLFPARLRARRRGGSGVGKVADEDEGFEIITPGEDDGCTDDAERPWDDEEPVLVDDINAEERRRRHVAHLAAIWKERQEVRSRARALGVQVDGWGRRGEELMDLDSSSTD